MSKKPRGKQSTTERRLQNKLRRLEARLKFVEETHADTCRALQECRKELDFTDFQLKLALSGLTFYASKISWEESIQLASPIVNFHSHDITKMPPKAHTDNGRLAREIITAMNIDIAQWEGIKKNLLEKAGNEPATREGQDNAERPIEPTTRRISAVAPS